MKNKNIKDKDIDGIVEVLDKIFNVSIVEQGQDFNIYKIGIWLNGLEINNNEIEINTVDDKIEKLKKYISTKILSRLKENEIENQGSLDEKEVQKLIFNFFEVRKYIPEGNREEGQITIIARMTSINEISDLVEQILRLRDKEIKQLKSKIEELSNYQVIVQGKVIIKNKKDRTLNVFLDTLKNWLGKLENKEIQLIIKEIK